MGIQDVADFDLSCEVVGEGVRLPREAWSMIEREAEHRVVEAMLEV